MIEIVCYTCKIPFLRYPSRIKQGKKNFCSHKCRAPFVIKTLSKYDTRFKKGHQNPPEHYKKLANLLKDEGHPAWKGNKVSYRGLHQWVRRNKGHCHECSKCGFQSDKPRLIQWANIDGKYRRNLDDFIPLCVSCHKNHDLALK